MMVYSSIKNNYFSQLTEASRIKVAVKFLLRQWQGRVRALNYRVFVFKFSGPY